MKRTLTLIVTTLALSLNMIACVDDKPVEEPVQAEAKPDPKNELTVKPDGTIEFKAEIVYFKFDDHTLTEDGKSRLNALGDYLKKNPKQDLQIQGHCDERGSTEYNLALGELRSKAVRSYLTAYGVKNDRLKAISYGEEKPAKEGRGEDIWRENRRADFVLTAATAE